MKIHELTVLPDAPKELQKLQELAYNIYFSWNEEVVDLYKQMDQRLWELCESSPVRFLSEVSSEILKEYSENKSYIKELNRVYDNYTDYLQGNTWFEGHYQKPQKENLAYFCCEFGLHECVPVYSGGLGVLSGDHIKTASDLGLPLVGMGLFYRSGYFSQQIDQEGVQLEHYSHKNFYNIPVTQVFDIKGTPLLMSLDMPEGKLWFDVWKLDVGRVNIFLLNTYVPQNTLQMQSITDKLYDSDRETRILQEYLLGVGGFRVLQYLGHDIEMYHINEGHSAFLLLEHIRSLMKKNDLIFEAARHFVTESACFTTHTPVPAGNERFSIGLMEKYFMNFAKELGLSWDFFLSLGREFPENHQEEFCLTILALKLCNRINGVSKLHGEVSRNMWKNIYPNIPVREVPISSITNGVHGQTWTHKDLKNLLLNKVRVKTPYILYNKEFYQRVFDINDKTLWNWKQQAKRELIDYTRMHLEQQYIRCNAGQMLIEQAKSVLDPNALTIGFARRFATYKRGNLFLQDRKRLLKMMSNEKCPIQFIIAGKSHPADQTGKDIIRSIYTAARELSLEHKIVFLENYNISVAKYIVSGVDIWLNNPIKPQEASGTSGMKAAMNGSLNLSIADGWWAEAYNQNIGWNISSALEFNDLNAQNSVEADILYNLLEKEILPTYFDRNEQGISNKWITMMKHSIAEVGSDFNAVRMLEEYVESYMSAVGSTRKLRKENFKGINDFTDWKVNIYKNWGAVRILSLDKPQAQKVRREEVLEIESKVCLGNLKPTDVQVECYYGQLDADNQITKGHTIPMEFVSQDKDSATYKVKFSPNKGGKFGYTMRIFPTNTSMANQFFLGLLNWYEG